MRDDQSIYLCAEKNNWILEKSKTNGFSGLASVVDTKSLALPEKWDLANKMSEHITLETIKEAINNSQSKNSTIGAFRAEAKQYAVKGEEKIFWQQLSIGIKDISTRIKHKSGLYKEIERALASSEVFKNISHSFCYVRAKRLWHNA